MSDDSTSRGSSPDRRDFVRRLLATAAVVPPAFAMLGATAAEQRQSPFEKARAILRDSRTLARRAKGSEKGERRTSMLTELRAMERDVKKLVGQLPESERGRFTSEITELKSSITELRKGTD